jgi:hypothetical protein
LELSCADLDGCVPFEDYVDAGSTFVTDDDSPGKTKANCSVVSRENEYCVETPAGSISGTKVIYPVEPVSNPGYYRLDIPYGAALDECTDRDTRSSCYSVVPCEPYEACLGGNACLKGYTGERCALCCDYSQSYLDKERTIKNPECWKEGAEDAKDDPIKFYRMSGECVPCPENPLMLIGMIIGALFFGGAGCYILQRKQVSLGVLSIGVDYFQVLSMFAAAKVDWPESIQKIYFYLSFFNFNLGITAPECAFTITYSSKWWITVCLPVVGFTGMFAVAKYKTYVKRYLKHRMGKKATTHEHQIVGTGLYVFYFVYLYMCQVTLDVFNCSTIVSLDGVEDAGDNGEGYMTSEPTEPCYDESGSFQHTLVWPAVWFFCIYGLGYPAICFWLLVAVGENKKLAMEDQIVRAQVSGLEENTRRASSTVSAFHNSFETYSPTTVHSPTTIRRASRTHARTTPTATSSGSATPRCTTNSNRSTGTGVWSRSHASSCSLCVSSCSGRMRHSSYVQCSSSCSPHTWYKCAAR